MPQTSIVEYYKGIVSKEDNETLKKLVIDATEDAYTRIGGMTFPLESLMVSMTVGREPMVVRVDENAYRQAKTQNKPMMSTRAILAWMDKSQSGSDFDSIITPNNNLETKKKMDNSTKFLIFSIIVSIIAVIAIVGALVFNKTAPEKPKVESSSQVEKQKEEYVEPSKLIDKRMPDLVGLDKTKAESVLMSSVDMTGREIEWTEAPSETVESGKVISQIPNAGTDWAKFSGKKVTVTVSTGKEGGKFPEFAGVGVALVKEYLKGTTIRGDFVDENSTQPKGTIISVSVPSGTPVKDVKRVTFTVSSGKNNVPHVEGFTKEDAQRALAESGFNSAVLDKETPNKTEDGRVLSFTPNSEAQVGATVYLTVGKYVEPDNKTPEVTQSPEPSIPAPSGGTHEREQRP